MNTYDVSRESTSIYMEQNVELKTLGLHTFGHHATRPLGCVSLGTMKRKACGLRTLWAPWSKRLLDCVSLGIRMRRKQMMNMHSMIMICNMFYDDFMTKCISMPMNLNGIKHMYTVTARLHRCFIWNFMLDVPIYLWV
jgi:hypothetical protein